MLITIKCMTKCFLDSNILIYFINSTSLKYKESRDLIKLLLSQNIQIYVSSLCLDEFIHETGKYLLKEFGQKKYYENLENALNEILELPNISLVSPPTDIFSQKQIIEIMRTYALRPRDGYHLLTMQSNNIDGFATFDNDFKKVFSAKLLQKA